MTDNSKSKKAQARDKLRPLYLQAVLEFERELANRKGAPDIEKLPHIQYRPKFEILAAALLALGVAGMSLLGNYIVFNKILHWTF